MSRMNSSVAFATAVRPGNAVLVTPGPNAIDLRRSRDTFALSGNSKDSHDLVAVKLPFSSAAGGGRVAVVGVPSAPCQRLPAASRSGWARRRIGADWALQPGDNLCQCLSLSAA